MTPTAPCARCGARAFVVFEPATLPDGQSANGTIPLAVGARYAWSPSGGFFQGGTMIAVHVDAAVCEGCGAVELRARDMQHLRALVDAGAARRVLVP